MVKNKGFTLIELLVVISIISLLSSIGVAALNSARSKAMDSRKLAELNMLIKAVQRYHLDTGNMPANVYAGGWCVPGTTYTDGPPDGVCLGELLSDGYLPQLPISPDTRRYYYYNYSSFGLVSTQLNPERYGYGTRGWHCSDATGGVPGSRYYCFEFTK